MKVILVDDERLARKELSGLLAAYPEVEIVDECANVNEAAESIRKHRPDLVFLDIQMPGKNGFELFNEMDAVPEVIFVTAYDEYAIRAFEVNALDYLLKPVHPGRLEEAMKKFLSREPQPMPENLEKLREDDQIFLKDGEKCWFVTLKDVRMFESEGNYVRVFFHDQKPLILKSLNNLEKRLDQRVFFRANRKFIVNLRLIKRIENWFNGGLMVEMQDGTKVEISRRQAARFKELMTL
jgi:two-component system LytT family response regulator